MTISEWRVLCRLGRHHHIHVSDGNPENQRAGHLRCMRCGREKDTVEYERASSTWLTKGGPFIG